MDAPDGLVLRPVTPLDVPALTRLLHAAYADLAAAGLNFTGATQDEATTASRSLGVGASWVLVDAGERLVGTVTASSPPGRGIRSLTSLALEPDRVWLNQLAVHPDARGQGLATALWGAVRGWALERGMRSVGLDTAVPAAALRSMYRRWGFVDADTVQWPGKSYRSVVMLHDLPRPPRG
ncbi:GCN5-related N-acetyltransferase [Cellulomonas flavigena DSM 20109]|uniref:GCN5-related N-acetyltransferase n=1 Tax=Cellulomonas flavigena (strain ATCC 482 / DSM 20109 / BCRC 11376 / JCM 18109 / NBRC 3775 / NCIMB 8073 / NRS 134) TaxID=446466 RepID=D5UKG7_CELFN|nr:GNAT family N-acetyltransferase [Cellulomonas flavigena]ADG75828.1 GCN5-related N-acetyltransferase [Cellulomonas flavigena DSM 20109]